MVNQLICELVQRQTVPQLVFDHHMRQNNLRVELVRLQQRVRDLFRFAIPAPVDQPTYMGHLNVNILVWSRVSLVA